MREKEDILRDGQNTRFSKDNQPENRGRKKGVPNTATRLARFLNTKMKGKNPFTGEEEEFTVAEMMDLKQVEKSLKGDTWAWEKVNDRMEGRTVQKTENTNVEYTAGGAITKSLTAEEAAIMRKLVGEETDQPDSQDEDE
jgi:hypothetical protein